jgi:hypothetical protein
MAAYDYDMDAKLRQFIGCRPANTARSSSNKCCQRIGSHLESPIQILGVIVRNFCLNQYYLTVAVAEATTTNSSRRRSATPLIAVASFWFHMLNEMSSGGRLRPSAATQGWAARNNLGIA